MRSGDRKQRWQSSCCAEGAIMLFISGFFIVGGLTADKGSWILISWGIICLACSMGSLRSARRGWKIRYDLPPNYYRDIKSPNPMIRQMAKECAETVMKEAKNPNRKRYAFKE